MKRLKKYTRKSAVVETLVIVACLGVVAAMAIPGSSKASTQTIKPATDLAMSPALDALKQARMQMELFRLQHGNKSPQIDSTWAILLNKSTGVFTGPGADAKGGPYGPYLLEKPRNPLNNSTSVDSKLTGNATGWMYAGGKLKLVVPSTTKDRGDYPYFFGKPEQNNDDFIFVP